MVRLATTTRVVTEALAEAERLRGQAQIAGDDNKVKWFEAVVAATRARDLLAEGEADQALRQRVDDVLAGLVREQAAAPEQAAEMERDRKLLGELEAIRGNRSEHNDPKRTDTDYAAAFRAFGIDLDQLGPEEAGKQIGRRSAPVELVSYLDDWAVQRRKARDKEDEASWRRLLAAAQVADPNPWRGALRDQIGRDGIEALRGLSANEKDLEAQSPASLVLLAVALQGQGDRTLAERVLKRAWRIKPDDFWVNSALAGVHSLGSFYDRPEEAVRYLSVAVAMRRRSFIAHVNLGAALHHQGKVEEAIAEYRESLRLNPDSPVAHQNLGEALRLQGKLEDAIAEFRAAIRLKPDHAEARNGLGVALCSHGEYTEAIVELRKARDLAKTDAALARQFEQNLIVTEQQARLAARLPAVLAGKRKPADAAESLGFAQLCYDKKLHSSSARLWTEAFQAGPKLVDDMQAGNRYNAACASALAGSGQVKDDPPLDEPTRTQWRKQAIDWLKADLAAWSTLLEKGPPAARRAISETLQYWRADSDLAGVRDAAALAKLNQDEQKACRELWADVNALLKKAQDAKP